jgi:ribonuclease BN (tRNA processing enzyme)
VKLTFLGTGSAFTVGDNFHSNMLLESGSGKKLLIDCGSDARHSLAKVGFGYADIDAVYISHLHADHSGGLEWLAFSTKFSADCHRPTLFIHETMVNTLWDNQLSAGLKPLGSTSGTLATYFDVKPLKKVFDWEGVRFELVQSMHIQEGSKWVSTFGLIFKVGTHEIFITTDTQFAEDHFMPYYERAEVIFHDCETASDTSEVHTSYAQLKNLTAHIKDKMWLYHYNPGALPNATRDGFLGFVARGQSFEF